ncbi:hypothetical protein LSTR_LSTR006867 [Laodelphax striatellus]|uniref:Peptidase M12B domain-containing protein n=1 Tax=Laodelphax striatellus TaxID=195883 RepID=A0A482XF08_LAOST|nr:hypothetical protein LSTR_LSTR006867 [Laodelphax striatellus]
MQLYFVNYAPIIYTIFNFHVYLVCTSPLDDFFPYNSLTEDMRKAGFGDGIRDFNFIVPKKLTADDSELSHFYKIEAYETSKRRKRASVEHSPKYLLPLGNKDHSEELELQIELKPNVELAPRSLLIERFDNESMLDVGRAKLRQLGDHRCYFVGHVTGQPGSTAALSACGRGLLGAVQLRDDRFYIQPLTTREANEGKPVHIVYRKKSRNNGGKQTHCLVKDPIAKELDNKEESLLNENLIITKSKTVDLYNFEKLFVDELSKNGFEFENNEIFEKQRESSKLHPTSNRRKRRDVEISEIQNQEEIYSHDVSTLDGDSLKLNSTLSCDEPMNLDLQDRDLFKDENSLNKTVRTGRSCGGIAPSKACDIVPKKRKIEPVYDIRVLIVVSKHFCEQFDTFDVETLILTMMNIVHVHFHDASIGQLFYVKVVRIIYVEYNLEELDERKHSLEELFANFCQFQERVNPLLLTHPNRHDIAIFLTQSALHNSCGNPPVYGVTYSKSVCREDKKCILVTNYGLLTANIITHALGHSLGAVHDDGAEDNCQSRAEDGSNYLMAPAITYSAASWSQCSRRAISRFVWHHASKCLLAYTKPVNFRWTRELLPGQIYTASQQCTLNYRMQTLACFNGDFCRRLYCKMNEHECVSNGEPPADGTYCAKNMWCVKGECRWKGASGAESSPEINGGWSDWSDWSPCSRHCGLGVQRANRYCNNPPPAKGGKICAGRRTRYRVCNQHVPCPISDPSFRDEQCQLTAPSDDGAGGPRTDWHEWSDGGVEDVGCALVCESFTGVVAVRDVPAANGSPCRPGTNDVCIRGQCVPVGCDWVLGSRTRRDACGVCRGGGTACKIIQGCYTERNGTGYVPFLKVPRGSAMIYVRQMKPSDAMLAVSSSNAGDFYLNGPSTEDDTSSPAMSRRFELAGAPAIYKSKAGMERLFIDGTVQEDLIFFLKFGNEGNPGVRYQLAVNRDKNSVFEPSYSWRFIEWEPCSNPCGGGYQVAEPVCVEDTNGMVDDLYCPEDQRPLPITRLCNSFPCKPRWWTGPWSKCFKHSNKRIKRRIVLCVLMQGATSPTFKIIPDSQCACKPKPPCLKLCKNKSGSNVEGPCPDEEDTLQSNYIQNPRYRQEQILMEGINRGVNNEWNKRVSNFHRNVNFDNQQSLTFEQTPSHQNLENDDYESIEQTMNPNDSLFTEQTMEDDLLREDSQLNSSHLLHRSDPGLSISDGLIIEGNFDTLEDNSVDEYGRISDEIHENLKRRKKSYKSKNKKTETSNDEEIFDQFFLDADDRESSTANTVESAMKHSTIQDDFYVRSTTANARVKDSIKRKHVNKSEITSVREENPPPHLKSKELKKLTSTPQGTLYGLLLTNKLGQPPTLKITKSHSNSAVLSKEKNTEPHSVVPDKNQFVQHNDTIRFVQHNKNRTVLVTTELIEVVASKEKQKIEAPVALPKEKQEIEAPVALPKQKQEMEAPAPKEKPEIVVAPARRTEATPCRTTEAAPCMGYRSDRCDPTCKCRVTTCRQPDLCFPTAAPDTPKKICHEIIENDMSSFLLFRAPIACERSINSYSDGMYEGDGLLSMLPVVNETCPIILKGDAALKYLEDRRSCVSGPIQQSNLHNII